MPLVAMIHASDAEPMRLQVPDELPIIWQALLDLESLTLWKITDLLLVARDAGIYLLVYIAVLISASVDVLYKNS
jgi:hypothetical protein